MDFRGNDNHKDNAENARRLASGFFHGITTSVQGGGDVSNASIHVDESNQRSHDACITPTPTALSYGKTLGLEILTCDGNVCSSFVAACVEPTGVLFLAKRAECVPIGCTRLGSVFARSECSSDNGYKQTTVFNYIKNFDVPNDRSISACGDHV